MATPNLGIVHIAAAQNQKEVTANTAFDELDEALCGLKSTAMTDANYSVPSTDFLQNMVLVFTGVLTADRNITVTANKRPFVISNQTTGGHNLIVKVGTGANTVTIPADSKYYWLYCDGLNSIRILQGASVTAGAITGIVALANGGTGSDLSATGGAHKFVRQNSSGANLDVVQPANADLTEYAKSDQVAQTADISSPITLGTPASNGRYRVSGYIIVTTADLVSSTLPSIVLAWTDPDNNTAQTLTLTPTNSGNLLTTLQEDTAVISAKSGVAITFTTSGYASGTPATMQFALHLVLERL